jgi:hypothetical protein
MNATAQALIGRFDTDACTFQARPIRAHGQPTRALRQLAAIYTRLPPSRANTVTDILMAHDWAEISVVAVPGRTDPYHDWIPGYGNCCPPDTSPGPVTGPNTDDQPWTAGEGASLWVN